MNNESPIPLEAAKPGEKDIPQNAPLRESSTAGGQENTRIVEVSFIGSNTPLRESSSKPPRRVPNAKRRSREFLTEAEVKALMVS